MTRWATKYPMKARRVISLEKKKNDDAASRARNKCSGQPEGGGVTWYLAPVPNTRIGIIYSPYWFACILPGREICVRRE